MKEISERIFDLLKKQGKTQKEFSIVTNIKESAISQWKADGTNPRAEHLAVIAKFFNVSSDYLIGLTDNPKPHYE